MADDMTTDEIAKARELCAPVGLTCDPTATEAIDNLRRALSRALDEMDKWNKILFFYRGSGSVLATANEKLNDENIKLRTVTEAAEKLCYMKNEPAAEEFESALKAWRESNDI